MYIEMDIIEYLQWMEFSGMIRCDTNMMRLD